jgi:hypothetical protein
MQHEIPQSLQSTIRLLEHSYPEGLSEDTLLPVLRLLYDKLSDRNLALVANRQVACLEPSIALNKIYEATALDLHDPRVQAAVERLKKHGYDAWLAEV